MEYRQLGRSGLKVPELCFGAGTFGAANEFFKAWSETTQEEANRIVDICMDSMRPRRWKRRCGRSMTWCARARYGTSRARIFRDGI